MCLAFWIQIYKSQIWPPRALSLRGCFEWSPLLCNEKFLSWWEWSFPGLECHNPSGTSGRSWCESCVTGILKVNRESLRNACIFFVLHHWKQRLSPTLLTPYHSYAVTHSSKVKCALFYNVFFFFLFPCRIKTSYLPDRVMLFQPPLPW